MASDVKDRSNVHHEKLYRVAIGGPCNGLTLIGTKRWNGKIHSEPNILGKYVWNSGLDTWIWLWD